MCHMNVSNAWYLGPEFIGINVSHLLQKFYSKSGFSDECIPYHENYLLSPKVAGWNTAPASHRSTVHQQEMPDSMATSQLGYPLN